MWKSSIARQANRAGVRYAGAVLMLVAAGSGVTPFAHGAGLPPVVESQPLPQGPPGAAAGGSTSIGVPLKLEDRVSRLERQMESQTLVDMLSRIDALQQEVQDLRGQLEVQTHKAEGLEQRQREIYLDVDRRLRQIETRPASGGAENTGAASAASGPAAGPSPTPGPSGPASAGETAASPSPPGPSATASVGATTTTQSNAERDAYQRAFDMMKAGRYDDSIAAFRGFLARYPDGEYSANAQYWLGEASYVLRRFDDAETEFGKVLQFFPDSAKAPDALLKLGFAQYELQEWDKASQTLSRVVQQYPKSTARQLAESRLQRMRMEGHK